MPFKKINENTLEFEIGLREKSNIEQAMEYLKKASNCLSDIEDNISGDGGINELDVIALEIFNDYYKLHNLLNDAVIK